MAFKFLTMSFSVDTNGVTIKRGDGGTDGEIPLGIHLKSINIYPENNANAYHIKGNYTGSVWNKTEGSYPLPTGSNPGETICYVKSDSGTITMNLDVEGT